MTHVELVRTQAQADAVYALAHEFIEWLRDRYPEMEAEIDAYLEHQRFDQQIRAPPKGECLLAVHDGEPIGTLMLKDVGDGVCEMNRMFVRESGRGLGAGRALVERLKERAVEMGFGSMALSALPRHHEALSLYRSSGFRLDDRPPDPGGSDNSILMRIDLGEPRPVQQSWPQTTGGRDRALVDDQG